MSINEIRSIFKKYTSQKGYKFEERPSVSTNSWYFKIYSGKDSLLFRVADHGSKKQLSTLRIDRKVSRDTVEYFIKKRCSDLSYRHVKHVLGM